MIQQNGGVVQRSLCKWDGCGINVSTQKKRLEKGLFWKLNEKIGYLSLQNLIRVLFKGIYLLQRSEK